MTEQNSINGGGDDAVRLAKRVAEIAACSRADAERYIAGGWVSVDGAVAEDPALRVTPVQDIVLLPGATAEEPLPVTILLHKPAGIGTTDALATIGPDNLVQEGRGGQRFLKRHLHKLTLATPLETMASGLLVFSQDWRMLRKLVEDGERIEHEYVVELASQIDADGLAKLIKAFAPAKVSRQSEARLRIAGKGIRTGRIEVICNGAGLPLTAIRRLRVGRLSLSSLPVGSWRYLGEFERF